MNRIVIALAFITLSTLPCRAQEQRKITLEALGGVTFPIGSATNQMTGGYNVLMGAGMNLGPSIAALVEFQYDHLGITQTTLKANNQPAGFNRFWSFSVSPRYYVHRNGKLGGYGTVGAGVYGRELAFTDPSQIQTYCDPYYGEGCESSGAPIVASNTTYRAGFNAGGGLTYSPFANRLKLVTDVRFNRLLANSNNSFITISLGFAY